MTSQADEVRKLIEQSDRLRRRATAMADMLGRLRWDGARWLRPRRWTIGVPKDRRKREFMELEPGELDALQEWLIARRIVLLAEADELDRKVTLAE